MTLPANLAARFLNTPLAIKADQAGLIVAALTEKPKAFDESSPSSARRSRDETGYDLIGGVAVIPVQGILVAKLGSMSWWFDGYLAGYDRIRFATLMALGDPDVQAIAYDIDSPGGEVAGCFDLVDAMFNVRGNKPMWAILSENAYSAGYAIASACDFITVPRTGGVGSVGCIMLHTDISRWLEEYGVNVTLIQYGARKSDGTDVKPLSKPALAKFQADIDAMGELFVKTVARNRGIDAGKIRATEANTFLGAQGVSIGLADAVMAPDAAFTALLKKLG